jgi:hypothetical protein
VNGADREIKLFKDGVWIIERAVFEYVDFSGFQDSNAL